MTNRGRALATVSALIVSVGLVWAAPASAGNDDDPTIKGSTKRRGPYSTHVPLTTSTEKFKTVHMKVRANSGGPAPATLSELQQSPVHKAKYFRGETNITQQVVGAGYEFTASSAKAKRFRVKIKARNSPSPGCIGVLVETPQGSNGLSIDLNGFPC